MKLPSPHKRQHTTMPPYFEIAKHIQTICVHQTPSWELFHTYIKPLQDQYDPIYEVMETVVIELKKLHVDFTHYHYVYELLNYSTYENVFTRDGRLKFTTNILLTHNITPILYSYYHTPEVIEIMQQPIEQLKQLAAMNHFPLEQIPREHRAYKYYWTKAYMETKKWGFNTFALRSRLNNDVLRYIRSYIQL